MDQDLYLLTQIVEKEKKYALEAYMFVREALAYASDGVELDCCADHVCEAHAEFTAKQSRPDQDFEVSELTGRRTRHVSGQELCEGIRQFALSQFGFMSKTVLNNWGIQTTSDFGAIVYKMINAGIMRKSSKDRRSHFDNVYNFDEVFEQKFDFSPVCCRQVPSKQARDIC